MVEGLFLPFMAHGEPTVADGNSDNHHMKPACYMQASEQVRCYTPFLHDFSVNADIRPDLKAPLERNIK